MQTYLADKMRTLTANHEELTTLINGEKFRQFDTGTQVRLLDLHDVLDAEMQTISRQVDALDKQVADLFLSFGL